MGLAYHAPSGCGAPVVVARGRDLESRFEVTPKTDLYQVG